MTVKVMGLAKPRLGQPLMLSGNLGRGLCRCAALRNSRCGPPPLPPPIISSKRCPVDFDAGRDRHEQRHYRNLVLADMLDEHDADAFLAIDDRQAPPVSLSSNSAPRPTGVQRGRCDA